MGKLLLGGSMFKNLLAIREDFDMSQSDVANIIGVNRSNISRWENCSVFIPIEHLNTYSNHFNVSFDFLAGLSSVKRYDDVNKVLDKRLVGSRLRKFRNSNGLTLRELAKVLNTSSSTLSAYETGKVLILTSFAYEICKRYNISMDWLCGKIKDSDC